MKKRINNYKNIIKTLGFEPSKDQQISLHYQRQATNQMQISYITEKKIHQILEHTGVLISPTKQDHRQKYFTATKPAKFFDTLVNPKNIDDSLVYALRNKFVQDFQSSVKLSVKLYDADTIPTFYNMRKDQLNDNGKMSFLSSRMSCMQGKPKSYFEVYAKTKGQRIAILEDNEGNMYGRALLWTDTHKQSAQDKEGNNYFYDVQRYYLDRIYIADSLSGSDEVRANYQYQMYNLVSNILHTSIDCYSLCHFRDKLKEGGHDSIKPSTTPKSDFCPQLIEGVSALDFDYYPYADTFQGLDGIAWSTDTDGEVGLTDTSGENANGERCSCDECGDRMHEEDSAYSEADEETLCEECRVWCDDRDEYINQSNAIENTYSGEFHHENDLNR
tara:strand:+ start:92 stop:1255 length:1164 start_codon:yes stop_codon:yes gene_type:complete